MRSFSKLTNGQEVFLVKDAKAREDISALKGTVDNIVIDTQLSSVSTNPVQNKVIKKALEDYGTDIEMTYAHTDHNLVISLKNEKGTTLDTKTVNIPLQSAIVDASYSNTTKKITFELHSGTTFEVDISDIISGLVSTSRKVAGIELTNDISVDSLKSAIGVATDNVLGLVKVDGTTVTVDENGVLHGSSQVDVATTETAGIVKPDGTTLTVDADGTLHGANTYTLPTASTTTLGGIKIDGSTITVNDSIISANIPSSLPANGGNSTTVNNHTVNADVPANAVFTDTTYSLATTSANGLMSSTQVSNLGRTHALHYGTREGNSGYYKILINDVNPWMLCFTIRLYQAYIYYDIVISGYYYGTNHWYQNSAILLGSRGNNIEVKFGYDSDNKLWVLIPAAAYTGLDIFNVTNGYTRIDLTNNLFSISNVSSIPNTVQSTVTAYRPATINEALLLTGGTMTGNLVGNGSNTISGFSKVYNAVWNDYAEYFERGGVTEAGDIIALNSEGDNYTKATSGDVVVGVDSNSYGHILGGENPPEDYEGTFEDYNKSNYIPVGMTGRVICKVIGKVKKGDEIYASDIPGVGTSTIGEKKSFVGYALENYNSNEVGTIKVLLR